MKLLRLLLASLVATFAIFAAPAFAVPLDLTTLTASIDITTIVAGILAMAVFGMGIHLAVVAVRYLRVAFK